MVSRGFGQTCVANSAGQVSCWGANDYGQAPPPADLGPVKQVSLGTVATCAITATDTVR